MRNKPKILISCFLLQMLVVAASFGTPHPHTKLERSFSYSNIPIRVLLDRSTRPLHLRTSQGPLLIKAPRAKKWKKLKSFTIITSRSQGGKRRLSVDNIPLSNRHLYLKAAKKDGLIQYEKTFYRGLLRLSLEEHHITVVNILPLEQYLVGILGGEMMASWKLEALKAQAVAARSYALYAKRFPRNRLYDLERSTHDQVYVASSAYPAIFKKAVSATAGQHLRNSRGPIKAFYHSRCGGKTELPGAVWNQKNSSHQTNVSCAYCRKHPHRWTASYDFSDLSRRLRLLTDPLRPLNIVAKKQAPSGRITDLRIGPLGKEKAIASEKLRSILGYGRLKSTLFDWTIKNRRLHFRGVGSGHGVGMCQWGAQHMAKQGKNYKEILAHYYPGPTIAGGDS